jgi:3-oxoadipate enol-lactonase
VLIASALTVSDSVRIAYRLEGAEGAPVLMLSNSLGTTLEMWSPQMEALTSRFRVLRYDSRGHGQSASPPGDYSMERLGRDALELIAGLGLEQVALCGLSKGGMVGQWLAAHAPERISRLILCNTSAYLKSGWQERIDRVRAQGMSAIADTVIDRWFTPHFRTNARSTVAAFRATLLAANPAGYAGCCAAIRDMDLRQSIRSIKAPCLVIASSADAATPPSHAELISVGISGSCLQMIDAAHLSNVEAGAHFTELLLGFLDESSHGS